MGWENPRHHVTAIRTTVRYNGLVESPEAFARGLQRGTGALVGGVVGGVFDSAAGVVKTVNNAAITLGADARYRAERRARHARLAAGDGGALGGLLYAALAVTS